MAVIGENDIWAVGEIYLNDSLGVPETTPYNAAHWDGQDWEILRVPYYYNGSPFYSGIRRILAFADNDIWFGVAALIHWNGSEYIAVDGHREIWGPNRINRIWGTSSEDFYLAGDNGSLAHFDGEDWQKLESDTQLNINDIWGSQHPTTGEWEILAVAYSSFTSNAKSLIQIKDNQTQILSTEGLGPGMYTVWFEAETRYFVGGNDLYQSFTNSDDWAINEQFQPGFVGSKVSVRGNGLNDMIVVGTHGLVMHFNGADWKLYDDQLLLPAGSGSYTSLAVQGNIVVAGGAHNDKGIVLIGKRE